MGEALKYLLILTLTFFSFKSHAGLLVEPYVGLDFSTSGKSQACCLGVSWFGFEIGGRIGYIWNEFMVGADVDTKNLEVDYEGSWPYGDDTNISNRGFFAGWMWDKWTLRLKYYFDSDWRPDNGPSNSGSGFGLDGAFNLSKHLSINLEITRINYDDYVNGDLETSDVLISVSFPFDLVTR